MYAISYTLWIAYWGSGRSINRVSVISLSTLSLIRTHHNLFLSRHPCRNVYFFIFITISLKSWAVTPLSYGWYIVVYPATTNLRIISNEFCFNSVRMSSYLAFSFNLSFRNNPLSEAVFVFPSGIISILFGAIPVLIRSYSSRQKLKGSPEWITADLLLFLVYAIFCILLSRFIFILCFNLGLSILLSAATLISTTCDGSSSSTSYKWLSSWDQYCFEDSS